MVNISTIYIQGVQGTEKLVIHEAGIRAPVAQLLAAVPKL